MSTRSFSLAALLASLAQLSLAAAQDRPAPVPQFGAGVEVVAVPVFVTDQGGRAVGGLTAADFEVTEDGKVVSVVGFHEVDASRPDLLPKDGQAALIARRQFLILFDLSFSSPSGVVRSREAATAFVRDKLAPADLAAVATFSINRGLQLLVGFTSDRSQLEQAIGTLGLLDTDRRGDRLNLVYGVGSADLPTSTSTGDLSKVETKDAAIMEELRELVVRVKKGDEAVYKQNVDTLVESFLHLGSALRSLQGRTQVVYLSGGFDEAMLVGAQGDDAARNSTAVIEGRLWEVDSAGHFGNAGIRQQLERAMKALAASDAVVHSIDVGGLSAAGDVSSNDRGVRGRSGEEALSQIARLSGGRFVRDSNDVGRGLDEILRATERYYLLAFEAQSTRKTSAFHKLKVKVKNRGYSVSHRPGYQEPDLKDRSREKPLWLAEQLLAAEAITKGVSATEAGGLQVDLLSVPYRDAEGKVLMAVVVEVAGASLLLGAKDVMPLEIHGYAFGADGKVADFVTLAASLQKEKVKTRLQARGLQAHALFTLPAGRYDLRFLVKDAATGRRGVRFAEIVVPAFDEGLMVFPAQVMDTPEEWVILAVKSQKTLSAGANPFRVNEAFFTPHLDAGLKNGRTDRLLVLAYTGSTTYEEGAAFQIGASLIDAGGTAVRLGKLQLAQQVAETDGFRRFVLNVTPESVPTGAYTLRFKLTDPATGTVHAAERPVRFE